MNTNNFKWSWCWDCNDSTIDLGKENTCCAKWYENPQLQREAWKWSKENPAPDSPTQDEIDNKLDCSEHTEQDKLICSIFDAYSYGTYYWLPKQWADKIGHTIPTYEELCEKYGFTPKYIVQHYGYIIDSIQEEFDSYDKALQFLKETLVNEIEDYKNCNLDEEIF